MSKTLAQRRFAERGVALRARGTEQDIHALRGVLEAAGWVVVRLSDFEPYPRQLHRGTMFLRVVPPLTPSASAPAADAPDLREGRDHDRE